MLPPLRSHGPRSHLSWTDEHDHFLGAAPDVDLAVVWGISHRPVWRRRTILGIQPYGTTKGGTIHWSEDMLLELGHCSDRTFARRHKMAVPTVALKRQSLGISNRQRLIAWTREMLDVQGNASDPIIALRFGLSRNSVAIKRRRLGIPPFRPDPATKAASLRDTS
jgi:hypothetical protein